MKFKIHILVGVILTNLLVGCSVKSESKVPQTETQTNTTEIQKDVIEQKETIKNEEVKSLDNAKEEVPVWTPKKIDTSLLNQFDSTKKNWGVLLKGKNLIPEVPKEMVDTLKKHNGYYVGDVEKKNVYLIFSASYEGGYTPKILDVLKENNVKATFFLVGDYVKDNKDLVKRMLDEGHEVGSHSLNHVCLPLVSNDKLKSQLEGFDQYFYDNFGKPIRYFMPPSGEYSEKVLAAANQMNYKSIFWSFAYLDFDEKNQKGTEYAYDKVMSNIHNGAFIFLHTVSKDNANALDKIIKDAKQEGYEVSPLDSL